MKSAGTRPPRLGITLGRQYTRRMMSALVNENQALRKQNALLGSQVDQYKTFFSQAPIGFHIVLAKEPTEHDNRPLGLILEVNDKWLELLGYSPEDRSSIVSKKTIFDFIVEADGQREDAIARFKIRLTGVDPGESSVIRQYRKKDGSILYIATYNSPIKDANGKIIQFQTSFQDITSLIRAERAEKLLKESERKAAVGEFIGFVSHNYKNSLVVLAAIVHSLKELDAAIRADIVSADGYQGLGQPLPHELISSLLDKQAQRESLARKLEEEIMNMDSSVKRMLDYSRSGTEVKMTIAVKDNLEHLLRLMNEVAKRKRIALLWDLAVLTDNHGIHVSLSGFQDTIRNLLSNAIEAIEPKDPRVLPREIRVTATIPDQSQLKLTICDTGIGMSEDRIRQLFHTVITSVKKSGSGLGIKEVIRFMGDSGGAISFSSQLGIGTTVELTFPLSEFIKAEVPPAGRISELTREVAGRFNVLLVDDNDSSIALYSALLETIGFQVTSVETAERALEEARLYPDKYDIVITDEGLPTIYGHELIDLLRPVLTKSRVCFIINSGYNRPPEDTHPVNVTLAQVNGKYLQKPASAGEFRRMISQFVIEWLNPKQGIV